MARLRAYDQVTRKYYDPTEPPPQVQDTVDGSTIEPNTITEDRLVAGLVGGSVSPTDNNAHSSLGGPVILVGDGFTKIFFTSDKFQTNSLLAQIESSLVSIDEMVRDGDLGKVTFNEAPTLDRKIFFYFTAKA